MDNGPHLPLWDRLPSLAFWSSPPSPPDHRPRADKAREPRPGRTPARSADLTRYGRGRCRLRLPYRCISPPAGRREGKALEPDLNPEHLVGKLDDLVAPAAEPENTVLVDQSRLIRWVGPMFALFSVVLVPWIVYIAVSLPSRQLSPNYDIAWAGFDVLLAAGLASSAYFALRRSRYLSAAAAATAALLVVDAWFDCMTTPGNARWRIDRLLLSRRAAAGGGVPVAQLPHRADRRAADPHPPASARPVLAVADDGRHPDQQHSRADGDDELARAAHNLAVEFPQMRTIGVDAQLPAGAAESPGRSRRNAAAAHAPPPPASRPIPVR